MKQIIIGFLIVIAIAVISFLIFKSCQDKPNIPPDNSRIEELEQRERQHLTHIALIQSKIDSLQNLKSQVVTSIIWRTTQIDSAIAKDSSNSLVEYRRSLQDNNYLPDGTLYLSYREIGLGAILMAKIPKLELTIDVQDSIIFNKDIIITDQDYIIDGHKEIIELKNLSIAYYRNTLQPPYKLRADIGVKNDFTQGKIIPSIYGRLTYKILNTNKFEAPIELEGLYNENGFGGSGRIGIGLKW